MSEPESSTVWQPSGHFRALDFYRFVAAVGVMVFHFSSMAGYANNSNLRYLVDFFFVLSGFVIMHSYIALRREEIGKFIARRLARIYPLHLLTLNIFIILGGLRLWQTGQHSERFDFEQVPFHLLMVHAWGFVQGAGAFNFVSWSISAEWFAYLLFPLLLWVHHKTASRWTLLALAIAGGVGLSLICQLTGIRSWTEWTFDGGAYRAIPSFVGGMAIRVIPLPRLPWPVVYLAGLGYVGLFFTDAPGEAFVVASVAFTALSVGTKNTGPFDWPRLKIFGDASYGIYMWHIGVGTVIFNIVGKAFLPTEPIVLMGVAMALTMLVSILCYYCFEKPARDWVRTALEPRLLSKPSTRPQPPALIQNRSEGSAPPGR